MDAPESRGGIIEFFFPPTRLTAEQTAAVIDAAVRAVPDASPWFVLVWRHGERDIFRVFFTPEQTTPRMRKGRCCVVTGPLAAGAAGVECDFDVTVYPYVQVSESSTTFDQTLEVPAAAGLPFHLPRNKDKSPAFSDDELVEIADLARAHLRREKYPISRIVDRGGRVEVHFRWSDSGGPVVFLSRANGTFSYAGSGSVRW